MMLQTSKMHLDLVKVRALLFVLDCLYCIYFSFKELMKKIELKNRTELNGSEILKLHKREYKSLNQQSLKSSRVYIELVV